MQDSTAAAFTLWSPQDSDEESLAKSYDSLRNASEHGVLDLKALSVHLKSFDENANEILMRYLNPDLISPGYLETTIRKRSERLDPSR